MKYLESIYYQIQNMFIIIINISPSRDMREWSPPNTIAFTIVLAVKPAVFHLTSKILPTLAY